MPAQSLEPPALWTLKYPNHGADSTQKRTILTRSSFPNDTRALRSSVIFSCLSQSETIVRLDVLEASFCRK